MTKIDATYKGDKTRQRNCLRHGNMSSNFSPTSFSEGTETCIPIAPQYNMTHTDAKKGVYTLSKKLFIHKLAIPKLIRQNKQQTNRWKLCTYGSTVPKLTKKTKSAMFELICLSPIPRRQKRKLLIHRFAISLHSNACLALRFF